jgi:hypothetical protein
MPGEIIRVHFPELHLHDCHRFWSIAACDVSRVPAGTPCRLTRGGVSTRHPSAALHTEAGCISARESRASVCASRIHAALQLFQLLPLVLDTNNNKH